MKRIGLGLLACILSFGIAGGALAQSDDPPALPPPTKPRPKKSKKLKRVVHSVELATSKKAKFSGNVTLRITSDHKGSDLTFYWGGKCKGTKVSKSRLDLMYTAMKEGYAVEIPAFPIKYKDRVIMCMQSIRVINE